jgi:hypothetical protein
MTVHTELTPAEAAGRLALRELSGADAHCADRRDAEGQGALRRGHPLRALRPPGAEAVARHVARTDPAARRRQPER